MYHFRYTNMLSGGAMSYHYSALDQAYSFTKPGIKIEVFKVNHSTKKLLYVYVYMYVCIHVYACTYV